MEMKNHIVNHRKKLGLSQTALSQKSKVGQSTISNIERGRHIPKVDIALLLAEALDCTVEDLFELTRED